MSKQVIIEEVQERGRVMQLYEKLRDSYASLIDRAELLSECQQSSSSESGESSAINSIVDKNIEK